MAMRSYTTDVDETPPVFVPAAPELIVSMPMPRLPAPQPLPAPEVEKPTSLTSMISQARQTIEQAIQVVKAALPMPAVTSAQNLLRWAREVKALGATRPDVAKAVATLELAYPPRPDGGGVFEAFKSFVVEVAEVAENSVALQVVAAVGTGGLSLVAQAGIDAATGREGAVTGLVRDVVEHPLEVVKSLPGVVLTETGLPGLALDALSLGGAAVHGGLGDDSAVGRAAGNIRDGAEGLQQAAKDDPVTSLQVIAGAVGTAVGIPGAASWLKKGLVGLFGGTEEPAPEQNTGIVPPGAAPSSASASRLSTRAKVTIVTTLGAAALLGALIAATDFSSPPTSPTSKP